MHVFSLGRFCASPKPSPRGEGGELCSPDEVGRSRLPPVPSGACLTSSLVCFCITCQAFFLSERKPASAPCAAPASCSARSPQRTQQPQARTTPLPGQPSHTTSLPGQPSRTTPLPGQPSRTTPLPGQPSCTTPLPGQPSRTTPLPGQPSRTTPLPGQPTRTTPLRGQPSRTTPLPGQPAKRRPIPRCGRFSTGFPQSFPHFCRFPTAAFFPLGFLRERQGQIF